MKSRLPEYCDQLHKLIERLRLIQTPIARLEIIIEFYGVDISQADGFSFAQILTQPFRRLRNVAKPSLRSISIRRHSGEEVFLTPDQTISLVSNEFYIYLTDLFQCMSSSQPPRKLPVFRAYWQLRHLLFYISQHYGRVRPRMEQINDLLHAARTARENENVTRFKEVWNHVLTI